jgi:hypothetical protein
MTTAEVLAENVAVKLHGPTWVTWAEPSRYSHRALFIEFLSATHARIQLTDLNRRSRILDVPRSHLTWPR